ncbi:hypothetical protein EV361DRAFT_305371 [Lentinula raphanica]|nr:hypothetical protein EV361DRAFT_305371 [Lentinula raphanica]
MQSQNASETETQFIDLPDDDVNLWDALEIVGESATRFKIKWDGIDPATGRRWLDSWVQKHDATPDLVKAWRIKHPHKISAAKKRSSKSTSRNSKGRGGSEASTSKRTSTFKSPLKYISRPLSDHIPRSGYDEYEEPPRAGPSNLQTKKRKHSPDFEMADESISMAPPKSKKQRATKTVQKIVNLKESRAGLVERRIERTREKEGQSTHH